MEKKKIAYGIISQGVYKEIDYLSLYRKQCRQLFIENHGIDYDCYLTDMICDGYDLTTEMLKYRSSELPNKLIVKINKWYSSCEHLMYDVMQWLKSDCNVEDVYEFINKGE